jgi:hypothetical protein
MLRSPLEGGSRGRETLDGDYTDQAVPQLLKCIKVKAQSRLYVINYAQQHKNMWGMEKNAFFKLPNCM